MPAMVRSPSSLGAARQGRLADKVALAILVAVCAVAAHQATYLLGVGGGRSGDAASTGGHDAYWAPLVVLVLLAAMVLSFVALRQLPRLAAHARHLDRGSHPDRERRTFMWNAATLWMRLGLATAVVYVIQENFERDLVGESLTGLDALAAHGLLPVLVILVTSLVVAVVAALVRWRCEVLLARLARADMQHPHRAFRSAPRPVSARLPRHSVPAAGGSRAPPVVALAV